MPGVAAKTAILRDKTAQLRGFDKKREANVAV